MFRRLLTSWKKRRLPTPRALMRRPLAVGMKKTKTRMTKKPRKRYGT